MANRVNVDINRSKKQLLYHFRSYQKKQKYSDDYYVVVRFKELVDFYSNQFQEVEIDIIFASFVLVSEISNISGENLSLDDPRLTAIHNADWKVAEWCSNHFRSWFMFRKRTAREYVICIDTFLSQYNQE